MRVYFNEINNIYKKEKKNRKEELGVLFSSNSSRLSVMVYYNFFLSFSFHYYIFIYFFLIFLLLVLKTLTLSQFSYIYK